MLQLHSGGQLVQHMLHIVHAMLTHTAPIAVTAAVAGCSGVGTLLLSLIQRSQQYLDAVLQLRVLLL